MLIVHLHVLQALGQQRPSVRMVLEVVLHRPRSGPLAASSTEASDGKKNANELFDQDKICNTMAVTSMAKAMRQHVGGKSFILDLFCLL